MLCRLLTLLRGDDLLLPVRQRDVHLLEGDGVERAGDLQPLGLLILPERGAGLFVELAAGLAGVEAAPFEERLRLLDLLSETLLFIKFSGVRIGADLLAFCPHL